MDPGNPLVVTRCGSYLCRFSMALHTNQHTCATACRGSVVYQYMVQLPCPIIAPMQLLSTVHTNNLQTE